MAIDTSAKETIRQYLTPSRQRDKFICPLCGSGTGKNGTAAFTIERDKHGAARGHCYACGFQGDVYDLVAQRDGISLSEAMQKVNGEQGAGTSNTRPLPAAQKQEHRTTRTNYTAYIDQCVRAFSGSDGERYMVSRGFTVESLERFMIGYDDKKREIIIPYGRDKTYYIGRSIDEKRFSKPPRGEAGAEPVYNALALYTSECVFVTESPIDAMSIMQAGGVAVAIGGTGDRKLRELLEGSPTEAALWIATDADDAGNAAAQKIIDSVYPYCPMVERADLMADGCKDPNEALSKDPALFAEAVRAYIDAAASARAEAVRQEQEAESLAINAYNEQNTAGMMPLFMEELRRAAGQQEIPTHFPTLDNALDGGLRKGLYFIGGVSSLGKTALVLQMADQIAAGGHDVLMFNLEMATTELMARSVSRMTYAIARAESIPTTCAKTTTGILKGWTHDGYAARDRELINKAMEAYRDTAGRHIWSIEGVGNIGTDAIREAVEKHIRMRGVRPVVIVDYLQILAPPSDPAYRAASDKQKTDKNVLELKRLSRDLAIPVIGISSFNRESYAQPVSMSAFKESGAIEYGCDVLIGLQIAGLDDCAGDKDRTREVVRAHEANNKNGDPVDIELKILKNRNGRKDTITLQFCAMFNCFMDYATHPDLTIERLRDVEGYNPFEDARII